MLTKIDVKNAYRVVPIHPVDQTSPSNSLEREMFIDRILPFGLRPAPKIFIALADTLEYITKQHGVEHLWHCPR